jgi:hypothetical protein
VPRRDRRGTDILGDPAEERIALLARFVLALRRALRAADADRRADQIRDLRDELRILRRVARSRAVIEVRDVQDEPEFLAQLGEDERECRGIRAARDGENDRPGAEDVVAACEGADAGDDVAWPRACHRWLGADSNRRPGGYESPALGQLSYPALLVRL